jgi:hypothetical protein
MVAKSDRLRDGKYFPGEDSSRFAFSRVPLRELGDARELTARFRRQASQVSPK